MLLSKVWVQDCCLRMILESLLEKQIPLLHLWGGSDLLGLGVGGV